MKLVGSFLLLTLALAGFYYVAYPRSPKIQGGLLQSSKPSPEKKVRETILHLDDGGYRIYLRPLFPDEKVKLITNFSLGQEGETLSKQNGCDFTINGGFYTSAKEPLGLYYSENKLRTLAVEGTFLDGFVWAGGGGNLQIGGQAPSDFTKLEFIFQSGPYFLLSQKSLTQFEKSRAPRALILETDKKDIYFSAVTSLENIFDGPAIGQLETIAHKLNSTLSLSIQKIINLDGGSTLSFLQNGEMSINEVKPSGSLLCVR